MFIKSLTEMYHFIISISYPVKPRRGVAFSPPLVQTDTIPAMAWYIIVHRQKNGGLEPAAFGTEEGTRVAVWDAAILGLNWVDDLVREGTAIRLGGNGYPFRYTAMAEHIIPNVPEGLPPRPPTSGHQANNPNYPQSHFFDRDLAKQCDFNEWLLVEVWDTS
jgi:hypothetical protein